MKTAVVAGCRTPFTRAGGSLAGASAQELGRHVVRELLARAEVRGSEIDQLVFGTVLHDPHAGNLAREVGLGVLPPSVPAHTVSMACASSAQAVASGVGLIETGQAQLVVAGGAESLSRVPIPVSEALAGALLKGSRARSLAGRLRAFQGIRPRDLLPVAPRISEPSTGETMGESADRMARENGISREAQDAWALRSHQRAAEGARLGTLAEEIAPIFPSPGFAQVTEDAGIRPATSQEALARLKPAFDAQWGTVTAGNASPLSDGASAVLLMSGSAVRDRGLRPMGWIRSVAVTALDPRDQLLQGPAHAAPLALDRAGITMAEVGLMEMHEAFAAQLLSNLQALDSRHFAESRLGRSQAVGLPPEDRINAWGGSIAIGHPFGATGARLCMTLLGGMARLDVEWGLLTVCAAGGLGFAMVLQRSES
jgi:acetyl-CoA acyltransferase